MKSTSTTLKVIISVIALLVFAAGIVLTLLGIYDFIHSFSFLTSADEDFVAGPMAVGLLKAVDLFLVAIVLFVFSLGILMLFNDKAETALPVNLPEWLRIKSFVQLKVILWEAILTTLVINFLAGLSEKRMQGVEMSVITLILPGAILLIALSLYFLKKGEK
ncbi:MAG TPA: YqhA family protein [Chitinophagaceae bacterium]